MKSSVETGIANSDGNNAMPDKIFEEIVAIAKDHAGLTISDKKRALVQSRVSKRLRALGLTDFNDYVDLVASGERSIELPNMISALTTNVSSFFRENHHFEKLKTEILPPLIEHAKSGGRVRIWSAGCSSGQEPYTIAMLLLQEQAKVCELNVKVLATDIDQEILSIAKKGEYDANQLEDIPIDLRNRYFRATVESPDTFVASSELRDLVTFRELNLLKSWPMRGEFDVIFCRNVVIYFDDLTQKSLWPRFRSKLTENGTLFVGHSERIATPEKFGFEACGVTTYDACMSAESIDRKSI